MDAVRNYIVNQNVLTWTVRSHRALLAPKARYGFRVVTQLDPLDAIVFAALVREIAEDIESRRVPLSQEAVYSYRVQITDDGQLFDPAVRYDTFLKRASAILANQRDFSHVVVSDIADFYPRIYLHRLENALNASTTRANHVRAVMQLLSGWNGTETFGIPVGNQPSRLLAEAALTNVDEALLAARVRFIRYNDDYRIFAQGRAEAYRHLAFLADVLYKNHGLTIQPQKTTILTKDEFQKRFLKSLEQRELDSMSTKFAKLIGELGLSNPYAEIDYSDLSPGQRALVDSLNLKQLFREEAKADNPDFMVIRFVLRRMAQFGDGSLADEVLDLLDNLYPIFPHIIEYLKSLRNLDPTQCDRIGGKVVDAVQHSIISELEYHRMWGLDLFSSSTKWNHADEFFQMLGHASDAVSRRKLILAMGRVQHRHWFQMQWRNLFNEAPWPKRAVIAASSCLPPDARRHWYNSIESRLDPLESAVMKWAKANPF